MIKLCVLRKWVEMECYLGFWEACIESRLCCSKAFTPRNAEWSTKRRKHRTPRLLGKMTVQGDGGVTGKDVEVRGCEMRLVSTKEMPSGLLRGERAELLGSDQFLKPIFVQLSEEAALSPKIRSTGSDRP